MGIFLELNLLHILAGRVLNPLQMQSHRELPGYI